MNRLIIIGNGFDLAHGLKTNYAHFMEFFWGTIQMANFKHNFLDIEGYVTHRIENCVGLSNLLFQLNNIYGVEFNKASKGMAYVWKQGERTLCTLTIKNYLFYQLCLVSENPKWSDIEMIYYKLLKEICPKELSGLNNEKEEQSLKAVQKLNADIHEFSRVFSKYLLEVIESKIQEIGVRIPAFDDLFRQGSLEYYSYKKLIKNECTHKYFHRIKEELPQYKDIQFPDYNDTLILNFNYTSTVNIYNHFSGRNFQEIKIHGSIHDSRNPILLGFGDEKDAFYQVIENLNENEYLEFIKSTHYAKNEYYKLLFDFIESGEFQVQIMGHSCGLSDRTLFNSIFQHKMCISIKTFFYEFSEKAAYNETDNFSQIFRNISRHFSDKVMMREKVVNKKYCIPLPQVFERTS